MKWRNDWMTRHILSPLIFFAAFVGLILVFWPHQPNNIDHGPKPVEWVLTPSRHYPDEECYQVQEKESNGTLFDHGTFCPVTPGQLKWR